MALNSVWSVRAQRAAVHKNLCKRDEDQSGVAGFGKQRVEEGCKGIS